MGNELFKCEISRSLLLLFQVINECKSKLSIKLFNRANNCMAPIFFLFHVGWPSTRTDRTKTLANYRWHSKVQRQIKVKHLSEMKQTLNIDCRN